MAKILFVSNDFAPSIGGIAQVLTYMCGSLPPDEVCVLAQKMKGDEAFDRQAPYKIHRVAYSSDSKLQSLLSVVRYSKAVRKICAQENCDLVFYDKAFPLGLISHLPMRPQMPYILQAYGNDIVTPRSKIEAQLQKLILRNARCVIAISHFTKEALLRLGVKPDNIVIMFPKMDFARFDVKQDTAQLKQQYNLLGKKVILSVGRLVRRKGFDKTIEAMPNILKEIPNAFYLIVGNGPDKEYLENLAEQQGVSGQFRIIPDCEDDILPQFYHACDVFCMPSRYIMEKGDVEGFGIVFLEANACKKPVVGGNSGGQPDAIEDGKNGLLCNPESPEDITEKILCLLSDTARSKAMGEYGYDRARNNFQIHHYGDELRLLKQRLLIDR